MSILISDGGALGSVSVDNSTLTVSGGVLSVSSSFVTKVNSEAPLITTSTSTSGTVNFANTALMETIYLSSSSLIVSITIPLPSITVAGQICRISARSIVTTISITGTVVGTLPITLAAFGHVAFQAVDNAGTFIRIE